MRYCGECGSSLGVESFYTLRCPSCGANIESNGSPAGVMNPELLENPTRAAVGYPVASAPSETEGRIPRQSASRPRRVLWALGLLAAALLLLAGGTALVLSRLGQGASTNHMTTTSSGVSDTGSSAGRTPQGSSGSSTVGSGPGGLPATANPSQTGVSTQSPISGSSPTAGATVTAGATPVATGTVGSKPTSTPTPAILSVSPTAFSGLLCINPGASKTFTISNNGGTLMHWTASSTFGYGVSPSGDSIGAGGSEQVSVTSILLSGTVTITAPGAENSPVQVQFSCLA